MRGLPPPRRITAALDVLLTSSQDRLLVGDRGQKFGVPGSRH